MRKTLLKFFTKPNLLLLLLLVLVVGAMYLLFARGGTNGGAGFGDLGRYFDSKNWNQGLTGANSDKNENAEENQNDQSAQNKNLKNQGQQNFTHPDLGFSFRYPADYKLTIVEEGEAENILVQKNGKGLEIYVSAYEGPRVSASLIQKEITDVKVENLNDIEMPNGILAVAFSYLDPSLGQVWNVWFSLESTNSGRSQKLYQITAQAGEDEALKLLVESLTFE